MWHACLNLHIVIPLPSPLFPHLPSLSPSSSLFFPPLENAQSQRCPQVHMQLHPHGPKISFFFLSFSLSFHLLISKFLCSLAAPAPPSPWLLQGGPVVAMMPVKCMVLILPPHHQAMCHACHLASSTNGTFPLCPHKPHCTPALPAAAPCSAV